MVHLQMNGFIGDNLFQYVAARIVAEQLGYALQVSHSKIKPESNVPNLIELLSHCRNAPLALTGQSYDSPVDYSTCEEEGVPDRESVGFAAAVANTEPRRIEMRGYYQRWDELRPYQAAIREWLAMSPCTGEHQIDPQDLVIHIRWGDMVVFNVAMSMQYYTDLLKTLDYKRLYVCGVGINAEVEAALAPFNPIYVQGSPAEDFRFMLAFNQMIQSNSGFSWWAGFLSEAEHIYSPLMGENTRTDKMREKPTNLMVDEPRYHYIQNVPFLARDFSLRDVFSSRDQLRKKRIVSSLLSLVKKYLK